MSDSRLLMVRASIVLVALCAIFSSAAYSETDTTDSGRTHHLGVLLGCGVASYREDLIVPISFDGPAFSLGGQYTAQAARTSLQLRLRVTTSVLENRYSHNAYTAAIELRPSWVKMLHGDPRGSQIWLGCALPLHMTNLLMESWDESHLYWLTTHSLALVAEYHTNMPRLGHSIARLELPVVGFVSRPPAYRYQKQEALTHWTYHITGPNRSFHLKTLWGFQSPMLQLMITRGSQGSLLSLGLEFGLDHCSEPRDVWGLNTRLVFTYQWRVG